MNYSILSCLFSSRNVVCSCLPCAWMWWCHTTSTSEVSCNYWPPLTMAPPVSLKKGWLFGAMNLTCLLIPLFNSLGIQNRQWTTYCWHTVIMIKWSTHLSILEVILTFLIDMTWISLIQYLLQSPVFIWMKFRRSFVCSRTLKCWYQ